MKGISTTLVIIVTAIVILIAALVVLTIFGGGIQPIVDITEARNLCMQQAAVTCQATNKMPPAWNGDLWYTVGGVRTKGSCRVIAECNDCPGCFPAA